MVNQFTGPGLHAVCWTSLKVGGKLICCVDYCELIIFFKINMHRISTQKLSTVEYWIYIDTIELIYSTEVTEMRI